MVPNSSTGTGKEKKVNIKKSFYPVKQFRISEETYQRLIAKKKKGTWNFFFEQTLDILDTLDTEKGKLDNEVDQASEP